MLDPATDVNELDIIAFEVYPNPIGAGHYMQVAMPDYNTTMRLEVFDMRGKMVLEKSNVSAEELFIAPQVMGNYLVRLMDENGAYGVKMISVQ